MADVNSENASQEKTEATAKVEFVENPFPVQEIFVDGIAGIFGRGGVFKIDCYSALGLNPETNTETRRITQRVVLPGSAMAELIKAVQGIVKSTEGSKKQSADPVPPRAGMN